MVFTSQSPPYKFEYLPTQLKKEKKKVVEPVSSGCIVNEQNFELMITVNFEWYSTPNPPVNVVAFNRIRVMNISVDWRERGQTGHDYNKKSIEKHPGNRYVTTPLSLIVASYPPAMLFYLIHYLP